MEEESWGRNQRAESWRGNHGEGIWEEESWRKNHGGGIMEQESWRRNHGEGIREEESWRRHHGRNPDRGGHQGGLMGEESWERNHEMEAPRRHPAGTSTKQRLPRGSQKAPRRHPGGTQEAPRGTQGTQEAPGGLGSKKVTKPLCFTIESGASDHFACTRRARPSPSTVNYSKNERRYARTFPRRLHSPF